MGVVDPMERSEAESRGLGKLMDSYADLGDDDATFPRVLANAPGYAEAIGDAMAKAHMGGAVDHQLKEIIRIQLARMAGDTYFAGLRSKAAMNSGLTEARIDAAAPSTFEQSAEFTEAEKWALRYAATMYREPESVDAAFYDEGKRHFSEAEIMELGGMIAVHYGMQVFMSTLHRGPTAPR